MRLASIWAAAALALVLSDLGAAERAPDVAVREATEELQARIREDREQYLANPAKFYAMVDQVVVPRFDTELIGKHVLGRHWRAASKAQRARFVQAFKNSLVHSYADALLRYADTVKAEWKPLRAADDANDATVHVSLMRQNKPPIPLGFAVHLIDGEWKVYDVSIEGISLATTFRGQFNAEIKKTGLEPLIARLEQGDKPLPETTEAQFEKPQS